MSFLNSIKNNSTKHEIPFDHWEYSDALSEGSIEEIIKADIPDFSKLNLSYDGTRAIDGGSADFREGIASGGKAIKFRASLPQILQSISICFLWSKAPIAMCLSLMLGTFIPINVPQLLQN